jgi:phospholipid/cholesterol/gamma-HCH transport system substrate-binding protein
VSDYETTQRKRNIIVGLFIIIGLCALVWMILRFGDLPSVVSKVRSFQVYVQFPTAPGVQKDTPVRFCGYQIGRVTYVMPPAIRKDLNTGQDYHQTVVMLSIEKKYVNIPSNVEVKLMTRGLGSSYIELRIDPATLPAPPLDPNRPETRFLVSGMLLQGSTGMTSEFFPEESQKKLVELIDGIGTFISNANDIIGDPNNKQNIKLTLANLTDASEQATQVMKKAEKTLEQFKEFAATGTETLKSADAKAEKAIIAIVDMSEQLSATLSQLRLMIEKVNEGQGTASKLLNDGRLYESLLESTEQLNVLLKDLKLFVEKAEDKGVPIKLK